MKTSIIILTYNKLDYTKLCIESIRKYTKEGTYEIIVVDNNSTDDTALWLNQQKDIKTILNAENLGFPKGCNQGIEIASGENILLLNNDVIVTKSWLENMERCLYNSENVGAVGCVTNSCSYYHVINVQYDSIEKMQEFAVQYNVPNSDLWEERLKLVGFCMLIKKEVVDKVGILDEQFTPGNYEDDDYSARIRKAGYRLILCKDTFIHHFGSTSFKENNVAFLKLLETNRKKFEDKWGFDPDYFQIIRFDMINLINIPQNSPVKILEIGCLSGGTLLQIKNMYKNASLYGLERSEKFFIRGARL
jgi:O-antigen biosynthesis protein